MTPAINLATTTEATAHVIATLAMRPNTPEWKILREFERVEGYHLHGEKPQT